MVDLARRENRWTMTHTIGDELCWVSILGSLSEMGGRTAGAAATVFHALAGVIL